MRCEIVHHPSLTHTVYMARYQWSAESLRQKNATPVLVPQHISAEAEETGHG